MVAKETVESRDRVSRRAFVEAAAVGAAAWPLARAQVPDLTATGPISVEEALSMAQQRREELGRTTLTPGFDSQPIR